MLRALLDRRSRRSRPSPPAACRLRSPASLRIAAMSLVFGSANASSSITTDLFVSHLGGQRHPRGQLQRLARQAVAVVAVDAWRRCDRRRGGCRCAANRRGRCPCPSGDTSSWSSRRPSPRDLGLVRTLPQVGLVHHHRVVQQLLVDARSEIGRARCRTCRLSCPCDRILSSFGHDSFTISDCRFASSTATYSLFVCLNDHIAAVRARHRAADQQQVVLGVDPHELLIADRRLRVAVLAGHPRPFNDAAGERTAAGAADVRDALLHAVRGPLAGEVVPLS